MAEKTSDGIRKVFQELNSKTLRAMEGGGAQRVEQQHQRGKLTARERLELLLDPGSFEEQGQLVTHRSRDFGLEKINYPGDGVVTGFGTIDGRLVFVYAQDFTVFGGSLSETHAEKIVRILELALKNGAPVIGLNDSGGARIQEGVVSLAGYADIFYRITRASGVVPQISAIMGPCAGGAVYAPAITDFILMVEKTSYMFVTGPQVVKTVTHEEVSAEELGGAQTHAMKSGVAHFTAVNEVECIRQIRKLLGYLPQNCEETPPEIPWSTGNESRPVLNNIIPENSLQSYDMRTVVHELADGGDFMEVHEAFAPNLIVGFTRIAKVDLWSILRRGPGGPGIPRTTGAKGGVSPWQRLTITKSFRFIRSRMPKSTQCSTTRMSVF